MKYVRWTRRKQVVYVHEFLREHRQFTMQDVEDVALDSINRDCEFRFELLVRNTVPEDSIITCVDRCGFDSPRVEVRLRDLKRKAGEEERTGHCNIGSGSWSRGKRSQPRTTSSWIVIQR